jgi:amidase
MRAPRRRWVAFRKLAVVLAIASAFSLYDESTPFAFNYVIDVNGTYWGIQDDDSPRVDTGSIRATQVAPGQAGAYTTGINGFGGIRVLVETTPAPYLNGELMRGFGLTFDGVNRFRTTQSLDMGGVTISRSVHINTNANWGRWLDTFTNTTQKPITIRVAFGGQSGQGTTGANTSEIVTTSSGDAVVTSEDAWVEYATPLQGATLVGGPQVTVLGTPSPFPGAMTFAGNWLYDTFTTPLAYSGHERNFQAYVNTLTLPPRSSRSLLHFIVLGRRVDETTSASERAAVEATGTDLAANPPVTDLSPAEICSIANFDIAAMTIPGFDHASCAHKKLTVVAQPRVPHKKKGHTAIRYDVVNKTIAQLRADMVAGLVTSEQITRAYLD